MPHLPAPAARLKDITAKWQYRSGAGHYAYDYGMPTGTPLYAVRAGVIADMRTGVVDYTPGRPGNKPGQPASGSPSNWVLLEVTYAGRKATVYYQHLKRVVVKKGQRVSEGQLIGYSGETGNATGPHLHIAAMWNNGIRHNVYTRYYYMKNSGKNAWIIYPPSLVWASTSTAPSIPPFPGTLKEGSRGPAVVAIQRRLKVPATGYFGPLTKAAVKKYQLVRPTLWPADGVVGPKTYRSIMS